MNRKSKLKKKREENGPGGRSQKVTDATNAVKSNDDIQYSIVILLITWLIILIIAIIYNI